MSIDNKLQKFIDNLVGKKVKSAEYLSSDRNYLVTVKGRSVDLLESEKHNKELYWSRLPKDIRDIIKSYLSDSIYTSVSVETFYGYVDPPKSIVKRRSSRDSYEKRSPRNSRRKKTYGTERRKCSPSVSRKRRGPGSRAERSRRRDSRSSRRRRRS